MAQTVGFLLLLVLCCFLKVRLIFLGDENSAAFVQPQHDEDGLPIPPPPPSVSFEFLRMSHTCTVYRLGTKFSHPTIPPTSQNPKLKNQFIRSLFSSLSSQFSDDEPPPPGTDFDTNKEKPSEKINSELASFYSEMASIDTDSMPATELPTSSTDTAQIIPNEIIATDAALKKKKKKVKKSEPWRSGNLETWINKWQKAQKELDG